MLSPSSYQFLGTGLGPVTVTITQANGGFVSVDASACSGILNVPGGELTYDSFNMYSLSTGICTIVVHGQNGQTANLTVSVTTTTVTGQ
jgi:hypothetical protein